MCLSRSLENIKLLAKSALNAREPQGPETTTNSPRAFSLGDPVAGRRESSRLDFPVEAMTSDTVDIVSTM